MKSICNAMALLALMALSVFAKTPQEFQDSLFQQASLADSSSQFQQAISFYQQALQYPGPHTPDIRDALQAYADVLKMPNIAPPPDTTHASVIDSTSSEEAADTLSAPVAAQNSSSQSDDALETDWSGSATLGGSLGKENLLMDNGTMKEQTRGLNAELEEDFSIYSGIYSHTFTADMSYSGGFVPKATNGSGLDTSIASSQTYDPSIAYTLGIGEFSIGITGDYLKVTGDTATFGVSVNSSFTLLRNEFLRWSLSGTYAYNPASPQYFSITTALANRSEKGLIVRGTVGFAGSIDSMSRLDFAVPEYDVLDSVFSLVATPTTTVYLNTQKLYATELGPQLGANLGYRFAHFKMLLSGSASLLQGLHKDSWTTYQTGSNSNIVSDSMISGYRMGPQNGLHAVIPITTIDEITTLYNQGLIGTPQYTELMLHTDMIAATDSTTNLFAILPKTSPATKHTYTKQDLSVTASLLFAYMLNESFEVDLQGSYQLQEYLNMPTDHPQYSGTQYSTITAQLSLVASF